MFKVFLRHITSILLLPLLYCTDSYADGTCTVYESIIQTVSFGTVNVQRDTPVGAIIATVNVPGRADLSAFSPTEKFYCGARLNMSYLGGIETDIPAVYKTNLDGVGIQMPGLPGYWGITSIGPNVNSHYYPSNYTVKLVKTGAMKSGKLSPGLIGQGYFQTSDKVFIQVSLDSASRVNVLACSITTPVLNFALGNISAGSFGTSVGTIPPGAQKSQNLGLKCDAGANINVTLQGTQNPDVTTNSILALTGQGNSDVAGGVGVQLLYNNSPLELNKRIVLKQSPGGQETFPIVARYYQTKTSVTTGKANTSATLDLTYQ